ncbi:hypothetical protein KKF84_03830 [Myxococcota bacterium]|nr:hypothetical protein [Myxococcota bacterium]MBU1534423.1 hypothetical protein [Myxococcota bacterium]
MQEVKSIPLTAILQDTTFQFRDQLRTNTLVASIQAEGIQFPVLRNLPRKGILKCMF